MSGDDFWDVIAATWEDGYWTGYRAANSQVRIRKRARDRRYYASAKGRENRLRKRAAMQGSSAAYQVTP